MTNGGSFRLIVNDGKQDRMLMATALLNRRLMDIEQMRSRDKTVVDCTPTLVDIERTHLLFLNAHFKPFAAIGYEYYVVQSTGRVSTGGSVNFSLPQYGDFFADMALHVILPNVFPARPAAPTNTQGTYIYTEKYVWCDYPGVRLLQNVAFTVNGNPLDQYDATVANLHQKFYITRDKEVGWNKCVGQANLVQGMGQYTAPGGFIDVMSFRHGPQVNASTAPLEMFIPLLFWFNLDFRLAIPSVAIPYGQRFIDIQFASIRQMLYVRREGQNNHLAQYLPVTIPEVTFGVCELYVNNIFVNPEIHDIYIRRIGFSLIRVHRQQKTTAKNADNLLLQSLKWPTETIYVGLSVDSQAANPVNWHKYGVITNTVVVSNFRELSEYTWAGPPTGPWTSDGGGGLSLTPGSVPGSLTNPTALNTEILTGGSTPPVIYTLFVDGNYITSPTTNTTVLYPFATGGIVGGYHTYWQQANRKPFVVSSCDSAFNTVGIQAHGIDLYKSYPSKFYNAYLPLSYGGQHIRTPEDCGVLMINFNLYPGSYQPSGHVNISRCREFYLIYSTAYDFSNVAATIVAVAVAINFLLISDGSAVLRYST